MKYYPYDKDITVLPYRSNWPSGVPKNFDELLRTHNGFIKKILKRYNKVDRNAMDLYQGVWASLISSDLLNKFVAGAQRRLPLTMTAMEAVEFLGITHKKWLTFVTTHELGLLVKPVLGSRRQMESVWETSAVCEFDYGGYLKGVKKLRQRPVVSAGGFKTYLQNSIHNAFANMCRHKARRYKEQLLTPQTVVTRTSDGSYKQVRELEGHSSWEVNITAAMTDEEGALDLVRIIRKLPFDLDSAEGLDLIEHLVHQGSATEDGPQRNQDLLKILAEGCTLAEADRRLQRRIRTRTRVAATG